MLVLCDAVAVAGNPAAVRLDGPFVLTDQHGEPRTERDFAGRYVLLAFGFTWCPDICPTTLGEISRALDRLEALAPEQAARVLPVFVSVDPARDTPDVLEQYLGHFHPGIVGLTGSEEAVRGMAESYGAWFRLGVADADGNYPVEHTGVVLLIGPGGDYLAQFDPGEGADAMLAGLERFVAP